MFVSGPDGNDVLLSIEHLRFADGTVNLNDGSALFDTLFYLRNQPDVFHADVDARAHYDSSAGARGAIRIAFFDSSGYLAVNPDVAAAGVNPLDHYHLFGWHEGRDPSALFDTRSISSAIPMSRRRASIRSSTISPLVRPKGASAMRRSGRIAAASTRSSICCTIRMWQPPASIR